MALGRRWRVPIIIALIPVGLITAHFLLRTYYRIKVWSGHRVEVVLEMDTTQLPASEVEGARLQTMEVLRKRLDQYGIPDPPMERSGVDRILLQLPVTGGGLSIERATQLIGRTGTLEFKLVRTEQETKHILEDLDRRVARALGDTVSNSLERGPILARARSYPELTWGGVLFREDEVPRLVELFQRVGVDTLLSADTQLSWDADVHALPDGWTGRVLYVLESRVQQSGSTIKNALMMIGLDSRMPKAPGVSLEFDKEGRQMFRRVTGSNVGRQLAIVVDGRVQSAPSIRERIPSGRCQITGSFTTDQARDLAIILRAGNLPAPIRVIGVSDVES
jgi:SecD/SecF fusion protein